MVLEVGVSILLSIIRERKGGGEWVGCGSGGSDIFDEILRHAIIPYWCNALEDQNLTLRNYAANIVNDIVLTLPHDSLDNLSDHFLLTMKNAKQRRTLVRMFACLFNGGLCTNESMLFVARKWFNRITHFKDDPVADVRIAWKQSLSHIWSDVLQKILATEAPSNENANNVNDCSFG